MKSMTNENIPIKFCEKLQTHNGYDSLSKKFRIFNAYELKMCAKA